MPAGRTDRGVHARMQVLSFRIPGDLPVERFQAELAELLPKDALGVVMIVEPAPSFHAQWSAIGKEYRYRIAIDEVPAAWSPFVWQVRREEGLAQFDARRFSECLARAVGTRDFIAFHEKSSVQRPRTLQSAEVMPVAPGVMEARLRGDSFARYQVRYLIGTCAKVASGTLPLESFVEALERGTPVRGLRAPSEALVLWEVLYPPKVDPFSGELRAKPCPPGVPNQPPFCTGATD